MTTTITTTEALGAAPPRDEAPAPLVRLDGLVAGYAGRALLPPLSLTIARGELWALVGRNGSGKSTLLRTLMGVLPRVAGRLDGPAGLRIAYVPQRGDYDPSVPARVIDFVRGGIDRGWSFLDPLRILRHRADVLGALEAADVAPLRDQPFQQLSEGQRQRVLIARALVSAPDLLVLDEPTSAMDPVHEREVFALLDRLRRDRGVAVLVASHQMELMPRYATHAVLVDRERGVALADRVEAVLASSAFQSRYGAAAAA